MKSNRKSRFRLYSLAIISIRQLGGPPQTTELANRRLNFTYRDVCAHNLADLYNQGLRTAGRPQALLSDRASSMCDGANSKCVWPMQRGNYLPVVFTVSIDSSNKAISIKIIIIIIIVIVIVIVIIIITLIAIDPRVSRHPHPRRACDPRIAAHGEDAWTRGCVHEGD